MSTMNIITDLGSSLEIDDLTKLERLLASKLANIPQYVIPSLTITDIVRQTPRAHYLRAIPPDLQLADFLSNRQLINRDNDRPIKDERVQSLHTTRLVFYYQLSETHQFRRFHDTSRWNFALFTAVLHATSSPTRRSEEITPAARRFMVSYLAAVLEHHNEPAMFTAREEFIRRWKSEVYDLFLDFKAAQKKFMVKQMRTLNREWERELDCVMREMGRTEYDRRVAPFVGCIFPGRKDQQLPTTLLDAHFEHPSPSTPDQAEADMINPLQDEQNELLEALRVPLEEAKWQKNAVHEEPGVTPVDLSFALSCVKNSRPVGMLSCLAAIFGTAEDARTKGQTGA
ncbi:hypothetical protein FB567DRAFT_588153 [Paraphoma chrysanthemicola]|uniref:Uncharacterized protein n=1 Tax=Paraphoma chrysanthemicola TaxID=798071 RepID=A0A8K0RDS9_9PLEO|nr:hypothetical protein FB567DRAFT_588153 [Paraphoma chrysanthemicola]